MNSDSIYTAEYVENTGAAYACLLRNDPLPSHRQEPLPFPNSDLDLDAPR